MSNLKTINLPDYGDFDEVEVIEICVESGQEVDSEEPILILETDKAAMEIPSSVNGIVNKVILNVGDKVKVGMPFLEIEVQENKEVDKTNIDIKEEVSVDEKTFMDDPPSAVDDAANVMSKQESNVINLNNHKSKNIHSGPATRKLAREFGINLSLVAGSGPKGRILKEDLHQYVKNILSSPQEQTFKSAQPDIDFSQWGNTKEVDLTKFQKTSLDNLHSSWVNIPHVTQHEEINISKLLSFPTNEIFTRTPSYVRVVVPGQGKTAWIVVNGNYPTIGDSVITENFPSIMIRPAIEDPIVTTIE